MKENAKLLGEGLLNLGYQLSTDGTENHLLLINLREKGITGSKVEYILEKVVFKIVNITIQENTNGHLLEHLTSLVDMICFSSMKILNLV